MDQPGPATRPERILGVGLAEDAVRQWSKSGELIRGGAGIAEVESHLVGLRLASADGALLAARSWWSGAPTTVTAGCTATSRSL
jgi:hypothetical protein